MMFAAGRARRTIVGLSLGLAMAPVGGCTGEGARAGADTSAHPPSVDETVISHLARLSASAIVPRFVEATALFLGTPYADGPLGEGAGADPDPDPRVDFGAADCVTYLEQSLALALTPASAPERFLDTLDRIRYRDANVDFASRNHYMVIDWIAANANLVTDVTRDVAAATPCGGVDPLPITRSIDRAAFLREQGVEPRPGLDGTATATIEIVPCGAAAAVAPALREGDLVFWVGRNESIFVVHTGLAVRGAEGDVRFRHASSNAGRVLDEPFTEYAARAGFAEGFLVLRLRDAGRG